MGRYLLIPIIALTTMLITSFGVAASDQAKAPSGNDTTAVLKFEGQEFVFHIGQIGQNDKGKTFVEISGDFDMRSKESLQNPYQIISAIMNVTISVGDTTMELNGLSVGEGGFESSWKIETGTVAKFRNIRFRFDTDAIPDKIMVSNAETSMITFDGHTRKIIK